MENSPQETCPICICDIDKGYTMRFHCNHLFHTECIDRWKERGGTTCPVCRYVIVKENQQHCFSDRSRQDWVYDEMNGLLRLQPEESDDDDMPMWWHRRGVRHSARDEQSIAADRRAVAEWLSAEEKRKLDE